MITLPPYIYDRDSYHKFPRQWRWIFNKLQVAERFGYKCGPVGTKPDEQLTVIVRPQMNIFGSGRGGFYEYDKWPFAAWDDAPNANPGYFWCEKFTGRHAYTGYVDDVAVHCAYSEPYDHEVGAVWNGIEDLSEAPTLPGFLAGISKYLYVESIGGNIIEVSPRLGMTGGRQKFIDEYELISPGWTPPPDLEYGLVGAKMVADPAGGLAWETDESTRKPFKDDP